VKKISTQRIICGDNLIILKELADKSVDLCYIDPPFFTNKNYEVIWKDGAEIRQFNDRWITSEKDSDKNPKRSSKDINVYLEFMEPRVKEIYRILKDTGSFYLHCDYHADAYLRILCDKIFDKEPMNRICWKRTNAKGNATKAFGVNHDVILIYTKSTKYTFNIQKVQSADLSGQYKKVDKIGKFRSITIIKANDYVNVSKGESRYFPSEDKTVQLDKDHGWVWTQDKLNAFVKDGGTFEWSSGGLPNYKKYLDDGVPCDDVWDGLYLHPSSKERLGYPTQKPESLLERIIKTSSNEGDLVLDGFCGCGTTLATCKKLKRQYIGIDVSPTACRLIAKRLGLPIQDIEGLPINSEEIGNLDGNEFQNFIIREFGGFSGKRGADGGIDGNLGDLLIQVKKFKAGRMHLDTFSGMLLREKKTEGVFIALEFSKDFRAEVARLKSENGIIIHWFDVQDIIDKKHYELVNEHIPKQGLEKYNTIKFNPNK
jgi:DNA modification methylase